MPDRVGIVRSALGPDVPEENGGCGTSYRSPWGTCCVEYPGAALLTNNFLSQYTGVWKLALTSYSRSPSEAIHVFGDDWAGALSETEEAKLFAAETLLNTNYGSYFLRALGDALDATELALLDDDTIETFEEIRSGAPFLSEALWRMFNGKDRLEYFIGKNDGKNPFFRLLYGGGDSGSVVKTLAGDLAAPDNFVYPLYWSDAMLFPTESGWIIDTVYTTVDLPGLGKVPAEVVTYSGVSVLELGAKERGTLSDIADFLLDPGAEYLDADGNARVFDLGTLETVVSGMLFNPANPINLLVFGTIMEVLGTTAYDLSWSLEAASEDWLLNDSLSHLLTGFATLFDGTASFLESWGFADKADALRAADDTALLGLSVDDADYLRFTLQTSVVDDGTVRPVIHIGDAAFHFYWDSYEATYTSQSAIANDWTHDDAVFEHGYEDWLLAASPTLQFVGALDLATAILEQMLNAECAALALVGVANTDTSIGSFVRKTLDDRGLSCLVDLLDGTSLSRVVALLFRQHLADSFILWAIQHGYDEACLLELFCWMRTSRQLSIVDAVLGPRIGSDEYTLWGATRAYSEGLLTALLSGDATKLCDRWEDLDCDEQDALRQFVGLDACGEDTLPERDVYPFAPVGPADAADEPRLGDVGEGTFVEPPPAIRDWGSLFEGFADAVRYAPADVVVDPARPPDYVRVLVPDLAPWISTTPPGYVKTLVPRIRVIR